MSWIWNISFKADVLFVSFTPTHNHAMFVMNQFCAPACELSKTVDKLCHDLNMVELNVCQMVLWSSLHSLSGSDLMLVVCLEIHTLYYSLVRIFFGNGYGSFFGNGYGSFFWNGYGSFWLKRVFVVFLEIIFTVLAWNIVIFMCELSGIKSDPFPLSANSWILCYCSSFAFISSNFISLSIHSLLLSPCFLNVGDIIYFMKVLYALMK